MQKSASEGLGRTLRDLRHDRGLTVEALARLSDVSVRTIMSIEHRNTNHRVDIVQRLADGLGVPLADLFAEPDGVAS